MLKVQEMIEANTALVLENNELKQRLKKTTKKLSMYGTERKQLKQENGRLLLEFGFDPEETEVFSEVSYEEKYEHLLESHRQLKEVRLSIDIERNDLIEENELLRRQLGRSDAT